MKKKKKKKKGSDLLCIEMSRYLFGEQHVIVVISYLIDK